MSPPPRANRDVVKLAVISSRTKVARVVDYTLVENKAPSYHPLGLDMGWLASKAAAA
jgi:hypothetical protein